MAFLYPRKYLEVFRQQIDEDGHQYKTDAGNNGQAQPPAAEVQGADDITVFIRHM